MEIQAFPTWYKCDPGAGLVDLDPGSVGDLVDEPHHARLALPQAGILVTVADPTCGQDETVCRLGCNVTMKFISKFGPRAANFTLSICLHAL